MPCTPRCALIAIILLLVAGCAGTETDDGTRSAEALYTDARESMRTGNYRQAIQRLEDLVAQYPFGDYALQSQLTIIYAHHQADQHQSAIAAAERFRRMHPRNEHVAYALYMSGVARQAQGPGGLAQVFGVDETLRDPEPNRRAFADFRELTRKYPDSEYVEDARDRMQQIRNELADYELYVADFYFQREAYIAAANRARAVVARYPGTPAVPPAMETLARAYRELQLHSLEEGVEDELEALDEVPAPPAGGPGKRL